MTAAARCAVPCTLWRLFSRRRIHLSRIIARRLAAAIGARHLIGVYLDEFFKTFSAFCAFVL